MGYTPPWDDLDAFLDNDDFATPAVTDSGARFNVIIEEQYLSHDLGAYALDAAEPWAAAKESDVQGLKKRARLVIAGVQYWLVHDPQPDGTGMAVLRLSRSQGDADSGDDNLTTFRKR